MDTLTTAEMEERLRKLEAEQSTIGRKLDPEKDSDLRQVCNSLRSTIRECELAARRIKDLPELKGEQAYAGQHGEMIAQSMLAVRHLEDARMRIGKVLQYAGDGVSIYDKA